jgi:hypothetical protein
MLWKIYVKIKTKTGHEWRPLKDSSGAIFTYATKEAAMRNCDWLYPHEVYGERILVADELPLN